MPCWACSPGKYGLALIQVSSACLQGESEEPLGFCVDNSKNEVVRLYCEGKGTKSGRFFIEV